MGRPAALRGRDQERGGADRPRRLVAQIPHRPFGPILDQYGAIMAVQAVVDPVERRNLLGDVLGLLVVAVVLARVDAEGG